MMKHMTFGIKRSAFRKSVFIAWVQLITSGKWVTPDRAARAPKFISIADRIKVANKLHVHPAAAAIAFWKSGT